MLPAVGHETSGGLIINVSNPKPVYHPGDYLEGTVTLDPGEHGPYETIILELFGRTVTEINYGDLTHPFGRKAQSPIVKVPVALHDSSMGPPVAVSPADDEGGAIAPRSWLFRVQLPIQVLTLPADPAKVGTAPHGTHHAGKVGKFSIGDDEIDFPPMRSFLPRSGGGGGGEPLSSTFFFRKYLPM
jgi:hypothetical protein